MSNPFEDQDSEIKPEEIYSEYVKIMREKTKQKNSFESFASFTVDFCEEHGLVAEFLSCKMNVLGFYAFSLYKSGEINLKKLEDIIVNTINKEPEDVSSLR
jgi:hypothetical protein